MNNIGLGGVLTFDSSGAVGNMAKASGAFASLQKSSNGFKNNIGGIRNGLSSLNFAGAALGAAGVYGLGSLVSRAFEANKEFESLRAMMATTLGVLDKGMSDNAAIKEAGAIMDQIEAAAAVIPGEAQDLAVTFQQMLGPMKRVGKSYDDILNLSQGITIAAAGLKVPFGDAAIAASKMASGLAEAGSDFFGRLRGLGVISETAAEWNKLKPEVRMAKMEEVFANFSARSAITADTWDALGGTITSISKVLMRSVGGPLFDTLKAKLNAVIERFGLAKAEGIRTMQAWGRSIGEKLVYALDVAILVGQKWIAWGKQAYTWYTRMTERLGAFTDKLGLTDQTTESWSVNLLAVAGVLGIIVPLLAAVMPIISMLSGVVGAVGNGLKFLVSAARMLPAAMSAIGAVGAPVLVPILAVVAGIALLFAAIRKDGESFTDTITRIWTDGIKPFWDGLTRGFMGQWDRIIGPLTKAWDTIKNAFTSGMEKMAGTFNLNAGQAESWGDTVGRIFGYIAVAIANVIEILSRWVPVFVDGFTKAWKTVSWFAGLAIDTFSAVHDAIKFMFDTLAEAVMGPIRFLARQMAAILTKMYSMPGMLTVLEGAGLGGGTNVWLQELGGGIWVADPNQPNVEELYMPGDHGYDEALAAQKKDSGMKDALAAANRVGPELQAERGKVEVKVDNNIHNCMKIDGKEVAMANSKYTNEIQDRAGAGSTPWQRRSAVVRATELKGDR